MKTSFQKTGYKLLLTLTVLAAFQATAFANNEVSSEATTQGPAGIAAMTLLLIALLVLPAIKGSRRVAHKK